MNLTELKEVIPFVTAVAAVLGAVAATVAAIFSALSHRRESAKNRTVIEAQPLWHPRGLPAMAVVLRNMGDETLVVTAAEICRPKGSKLAIDSEGLFGLTPSFNPPQRQDVKVNRVAFSFARMKGSSAVSALNEAVVPLYFDAPKNWDGGWIKIRIAVASLASDAKPRWITVKRCLDKRSVLAERAEPRDSSRVEGF
jgi:hypothetical protein